MMRKQRVIKMMMVGLGVAISSAAFAATNKYNFGGQGFGFGHGAIKPPANMTFTNAGIRDVTVSAGQLSGVDPQTGAALTASNLLPLKAKSLAVVGGTISGNGAGLTNLNGANLVGTVSYARLPADLANGDQGITNEVDPQVGTIALNYHPKWNGSTLVSGTVYDNGNVGIGTATPGAKLDVAGDVRIGGSAALRPSAGTIRWNGRDLEVYNATHWISLTTGGRTNVWPVAQNDAARTQTNTAVTVSVLANDIGEGLSVASVTQPGNGTVVNRGTNVVYTPAVNFAGTNVFTYVLGSWYGTATGRVAVVVTSTVPFDLSLIAGVEDYFAQPIKPASRGPRFELFGEAHNITNWTGFDDLAGVDQSLAHTFSNLPPAICSATLTLRLRANGGLCGNDAITLGLTDSNPPGEIWYRPIGSFYDGAVGLLNNPWDYGAVATFTLDLAALPLADGGATNILQQIQSDRALDIYVRDDTAVDYVKLSLRFCPDDPTIPSGMSLIPAGSFVMGDTFGEGWSEELPLHTVSVSAFYMDRTEVTKAKWDEVYTWAVANGYSFSNAGLGKGANHPVHTINWYDSVKWANARSQKEGLTPCYTVGGSAYKTGESAPDCNWSANGYRLPTEAEWEKAARGGAVGHRFPWSDSDTIQHARANYYAYPSGYAYDTNPTEGYHPTYNDGVDPYTSPVGVFGANGYGLYDMAGNVWEWCWDWYDGSYTSGTSTDPQGPGSGSYRVRRGGSWGGGAFSCRVARRRGAAPDGEDYHVGFRLARSVGP